MTEATNQYGQALYDLAKEEGLDQQILSEIRVLDNAFSETPDFLRVLSAPSVPKAQRCQILDDSFRGKVHPYVLNFMKILTERGYIRQFSGCCRVYEKSYNRDRGILPVTATSALALSEDLQAKLKEKLSSVTGKTIDLHCRVDGACLGGVRLDFDGKQVDGTVRRRLEDVRSLLRNTVL